MPQVIGQAVASYFFSSVFTPAAFLATKYAVTAGLYFLAGRYLYGQLRPPSPNIPSRPLSTRKQYLREPNAPQTIIYGETWTTPTIVAAYSDEEKLSLLLAVAPHELESEIVDVRVNDQTFLTAAELGRLNSFTLQQGGLVVQHSEANSSGLGDLRNQVNDRASKAGVDIMRLWRDFGATNPGTLGDVAHGGYTPLFPPKFGSDRGIDVRRLAMKMSGISWLLAVFPRDSQALRDANKLPVWSAIPTISLKVRRANSSLELPSGIDGSAYLRGNTALCAFDYLKRYTDYANPVCGIERLDEDSFKAAATFCESYKPLESTGDAGLTANGTISLATPPAETLDQLGLAMNSGVFPEFGGVRYCAQGAPGTAMQTLTDDIIVKDSWRYSLLTPVEQRVSQFVSRYADADGVEQSAGANYDTEATTASQELQLDLVNNRDQATQVANILLSRIWNGATLSLEVIDTRLPIKPYDKVRVEGCGALNIDDTFRILSIERTAGGRLSLQLQFEHPSLFDSGAAGTDYIPPSRLPNYGEVATDDTFRISLNGTQNRLLVRGAGASEASFLTYR